GGEGITSPPSVCKGREGTWVPVLHDTNVESHSIMPVTVVIGSQWGDEGKGKVVDLLSDEMDVVARYQGGANAGHTICFGDKTYVLHLVPSGIFHEGVTCVIGNGVVIDPVAVLDEIKMIRDL